MSKVISILNHTINEYEDWTPEELLENFNFSSKPNFNGISEMAIFNDCIDINYFNGQMVSWKNTFGTYTPTQIG